MGKTILAVRVTEESWEDIYGEHRRFVAECFPADVVVIGATLPEVFTNLGTQMEAELAHHGSFAEIPMRPPKTW